MERTEFREKVEQYENPLPLTVAVVDVDNFAEINQRLGREGGDDILESLAAVLADCLPDGAWLTRLGGDEFSAAFPGMRSEDVLLKVQRVHDRLSEAPLQTSAGPETVCVSIGIASFPAHAEQTAELLERADQALLSAKRQGRARSTIFVEEKMVLKSNYYPRAQLDRLAALAERTDRTEASILRQALGDYLEKNRDLL